MNMKSRLPNSRENDLPRELIDLANEIAQIPGPIRRDLDTAFSRVVDAVKRRRNYFPSNMSGSRSTPRQSAMRLM